MIMTNNNVKQVVSVIRGFDFTGLGTMMSGAAALFGAGNSIGAGNRQKRLMDYQYKKEEQYQKNMSAHNWTNYNSPAAQRRSMEAAGINPFAGDSSIGGMQMSSNSSGPDLQEAADPGAGFSSNIQAGASALFQMNEQKRVNDSIIYKNTSEGNKAQSDANKTNLMMPGSMTLQDLEVELKELGIDISEFDKIIKGVDAKYHEQLTLANLNQIRENVNESITRQNLNFSQQKVYEKMLYEIDAKIRKMNAEIKTEGAKQLNLGADTRLKGAMKETEGSKKQLYDSDKQLKDAQRQTENSLRNDRIRELAVRVTNADIDKVNKLVDTIRNIENTTKTSTPSEVAQRAVQATFGDGISSWDKEELVNGLITLLYNGAGLTGGVVRTPDPK